MENDYIQSIIKIIQKIYILPYKSKQKIPALWKRASSRAITEEEFLAIFIDFLKTLKKMPTQQSGNSYKAATVVELLDDFMPKSVLDIGAGQGIIAQSVGQYFQLPKPVVYGIDLQPIDNPNITVLQYDGKSLVPLPDKSVDLILLMSVLHHIDPDNRRHVLSEVSRLLSDDGRVVMREHDSDETYEFRIYLQFVHYVFYVAHNETHDPLYLMTKPELCDIMSQFGFELSREGPQEHRNPQRLYNCVFKKNIPPTNMDIQ